MADLNDVNPTKDSYLDGGNTSTNYGTDTTILAGLDLKGNKLRAILHFDLSPIPGGSTVTASNLELYISAFTGSGKAYTIHRITRSDWVEGEVTWLDYKSGSTWTVPGGDHSTPTKGFTGPSATGNFTISDLNSIIQDAIDSRDKHLHIIIIADDETGDDKYNITFRSLDHATSADRPELDVTYTPGATILSPSGIVSAEAVGAAAVAGPLTATGIASAEAVSVPHTFRVGFIDLTTSIASAEAFSFPVVTGGNNQRITVNAGSFALDGHSGNHFWRTSDDKLVCVYQRNAQDAYYNVSEDQGLTWVTADEVLIWDGTGTVGNDIAGVAVGDAFYGVIANLDGTPAGVIPFKIIYTVATETFDVTVGTQVDDDFGVTPQVIWNASTSRFLALVEHQSGVSFTLYEFDAALAKTREKDSSESGGVTYKSSLILLDGPTTKVGVFILDSGTEVFKSYIASGATFNAGLAETGLPTDVGNNPELVEAPGGKVDLVYATGGAVRYARRNAANNWDAAVDIDSNKPKFVALSVGGTASQAIAVYVRDASPKPIYFAVRDSAGNWGTPQSPPEWAPFEGSALAPTVEEDVSTGTFHVAIIHSSLDVWHLEAPPIRRLEDVGGIASAEGFGSPKINLRLTLTAGITSAEALGSSVVAGPLTATGIASSEAFGSLSIHLFVPVTGIASVEVFGTAQLNLSILAAGAIPTAESMGSPIVAGPISDAGAIASTETFGSAQLNLQLTATVIVSVEAFGTAQINLGVVASGIASAEAFGSTQLNLTLTPSGIVSAEALGSPNLNLKLEPAGVASGEAVPSPIVAGPISDAGAITSAEAFGTLQVDLSLSLTGITPAEVFGTAAITTGAVSISPSGIASAEALGTPAVNLAGLPQNITVGGIASAEAVGTAVVTGPVTVTGIVSLEAFGTLQITVGTVQVSPGSIASVEAFGALTVQQQVQLSAIVTAEAFGALVVTNPGGLQTLSPGAVGSVEAFGTAILSGGVVATGIASVEAFGTLTLTLQVSVTSILSGEAFGTASVSVRIVVTAIASGEAFGTLTLVVTITVTGIASAEAHGSPVVGLVTGPQTVVALPIPSLEAFGAVSIGQPTIGRVITVRGISSTTITLRGRNGPHTITARGGIGTTIMTRGDTV